MGLGGVEVYRLIRLSLTHHNGQTSLLQPCMAQALKMNTKPIKLHASRINKV